MDYCDGCSNVKHRSSEFPGWLQTRQNCNSGWYFASSRCHLTQWGVSWPISLQYVQINGPILKQPSGRCPCSQQILQYNRGSDDYELLYIMIGLRQRCRPTTCFCQPASPSLNFSSGLPHLGDESAIRTSPRCLTASTDSDLNHDPTSVGLWDLTRQHWQISSRNPQNLNNFFF